MIQAALSQLEVSYVNLIAQTALPLSVPLSSSAAVQFRVNGGGAVAGNTPINEQWLWLTGGLRIFSDDPALLVSGAVCIMTFPNNLILPSPLSFQPWVGLTGGFVAASLQGIEIPPNTLVDIFVQVTNSDAGVAHNILATSSGGILVRKLRLVTEIAMVNLVQQQADPNLARRLGRVR